MATQNHKIVGYENLKWYYIHALIGTTDFDPNAIERNYIVRAYTSFYVSTLLKDHFKNSNLIELYSEIHRLSDAEAEMLKGNCKVLKVKKYESTKSYRVATG
jgi:hypothetical protein